MNDSRRINETTGYSYSDPIDLTYDDDVIFISTIHSQDEICDICCEIRTGKMIECVKCVGKCCVVCLMMTDICPFCRQRR